MYVILYVLMYVCMCVCMYVIHVCMYVYMYVHVCMYVHIQDKLNVQFYSVTSGRAVASARQGFHLSFLFCLVYFVLFFFYKIKRLVQSYHGRL